MGYLLCVAASCSPPGTRGPRQPLPPEKMNLPPSTKSADIEAPLWYPPIFFFAIMGSDSIGANESTPFQVGIVSPSGPVPEVGMKNRIRKPERLRIHSIIRFPRAGRLGVPSLPMPHACDWASSSMICVRTSSRSLPARPSASWAVRRP